MIKGNTCTLLAQKLRNYPLMLKQRDDIQCEVTAKNANGPSNSCDGVLKANIVSKEVPGMCQNLQIVNRAEHRVTIGWDAPQPVGDAPVFSYKFSFYDVEDATDPDREITTATIS